ncbi:MAG: radical SAM protein [Planctomycetota bacterium]
MPETTAHRPTELPGWIRLEISRFSSEALNAVIGTWAARFRQIDFAGAVAAASQIVQQRPELATGYHLIMIAAGQAGDRPLERAMCEELLRVSMRRANVRMTQFYVAISEQLADASPEPTYRVTDEYTSCEWIEGGLTFGPNDVHACCIPNQGGKGGWVKLSPCTQEQAPSLVEILRARQELRHQAQSGGHAKCQGCSRLRKQDWSRPYLVDTLNFSHFQRCNLKCNYCYLEQPGFVPNETAWKQPHQLITHLRQLIDQKLLDPRAVVYWGGGEPTILDDFEDLLMALVRHGCSNVINTNGIKYSPAIEAALASRNTIVVCSIDAGSPGPPRSPVSI